MSEKDSIEREAEKSFAQQIAKQGELAKTLSVEVHGNVPQLKRRERGQLLGQFRERVLWGMTKNCVLGKGVLPSFQDALANPCAAKLLVRADFITQAMPYIKEAQRKNVSFTFVQSPEFAGDVAMVLVAHDAVDVGEIIIE